MLDVIHTHTLRPDRGYNGGSEVTMRKGMQFTLAASVVVALAVPAWAATTPTHVRHWTVATAGVWPPAISGDRVILKSGNTISAHSIKSGALLWKTKVKRLRYGSGVVAACDDYVYLVGSTGLHVLGAKDGQELHLRVMDEPISVLVHGTSVYVSSSKGVVRLNLSAKKTIGRARGISGELQGADGRYVALVTRKREKGKQVKRLEVVDLKKGKSIYRFKLLTRGAHQIVSFGGDKLVFIDYTRADAGGKNARKLYYTEADFVKFKKIRDVNLSAHYGDARSDQLRAVAGPGGQLFVVGQGGPGVKASLLAYDPPSGKLLWNRTGEVATMGLTLAGGALWTGVTDEQGASKAAVLQPDDGTVLFTLKLDAPGTGSPVAVGERVLVRTRKSVVCFGPAAQKVAATKPLDKAPPDKASPVDNKTAAPSLPTVGPGSRPRHRSLTDAAVGYRLEFPVRWTLDKARVLTMGGVRKVVPLVRHGKGRRRTVPVGAVQVLTWEAAGRDADGLWRSVYAQRKRLSPKLKVTAVHRVANAGGLGVSGIRAVYTFRGPKGAKMQMRSLCVVSHNVAFELRGWVRAKAPPAVWDQVEAIFASFKAIKK